MREVVVRGNERLDASFLRALSGITPETHLLKMDVKAVERALLTEPYVESVEVSRHFPATVSLDVKERKPVGYVCQSGRFALVAVDGMVLESVEQAPPALAEIRVAGMPLLVPGTRLESEGFLQVASLLSSMDESLATLVSAAGSSGGMLFLEARGIKVLYGDLSELERKNSITCLALAELVDRYGAVEYIDVSFPDRPAIKPVAEEEGESLGVP
ncbi:MAG: FtsQ-type POTRA domain-containing protein [Actinobacteria bacterium]|nr:FtsQ-type POTRA domain-containing protein [Actinomycetota bacterium]